MEENAEVKPSQVSFINEDESCSFTQGEYWSKEKLSTLISLYSEERDLWDTTRSPTFDQRQEAFERISNSIGCDGGCYCNLVLI